jgi:hypothetical protein
MSSTNISFRATFRIGDDIVPLLSEIAFGDSQSQDGVQNGFLFRLDLQPNDPPVQINLGALIGFVEQQLGVGSGNLPAVPVQNQRGRGEQRPNAGHHSSAADAGQLAEYSEPRHQFRGDDQERLKEMRCAYNR